MNWGFSNYLLYRAVRDAQIDARYSHPQPRSAQNTGIILVSAFAALPVALFALTSWPLYVLAWKICLGVLAVAGVISVLWGPPRGKPSPGLTALGLIASPFLLGTYLLACSLPLIPILWLGSHGL